MSACMTQKSFRKKIWREDLAMADTKGTSQNSQTSSQFSQSDLPELLHQYYKRLFPYKYFVQWLSYGGGRLFWGNEVKLLSI